MRILDRYVLTTFIVNYLLSLFVLVSLYVALDLFVNFDEFTEEGKPAGEVIASIADYYFFNLPLYFSQICGVITLFASCGTLVRLHRQNEITAILASGTSLYRLAAPIVIAGLVMNMLIVFDHEVVLPGVAPKLVRHRDDVAGARVYEVWCVKDGPHRLLSALQFSPKLGKIRGLIVMELSTRPEDYGRMRHLVTADQAEWDGGRGGWALLRGSRIEVEQESAAGFGSDRSMVPDAVDFYASELTPGELLLRQTTQWLRFLSVRQLSRLERRSDVDRATIAQIKHARFTAPINNMILLLIGISFFLNRLPGSILTQGGKALATCSVVFMVAFFVQQMLGTSGLIPGMPALPAWLPIFVFGPAAVVMLDTIKT